MSKVFDKTKNISQNFDDINKEKINIESSDDKDENTQNGLSLFSKIIFGIAGAPYQMFFSAISVFSTVFLLEVANLPPSKTSVILFVSRAVDAITDPIYGTLIDKTSPKKFGKFKLWILCSIPISALTYMMVWLVPNVSENGKFAWFLFWNCMFFTVLTGIRLPYVSLIRNLTKSKRERDNLTTIRMGFEMIGILAALGIQSPFVSTSGNCKRLNETSNNTFFINDTEEVAFQAESINKDFDQVSLWETNKYIIIAAILTAIFLITHIAFLVVIKENDEKTHEDDEDESKKVNTIKELKQMVTFKPFVILCMGTFLNTFGIQVMQNNLQLYFEFGYPAIRSLFVFAILGILGVSILVVPLWQFIMLKIGKRLAMMIGCSMILPLCISLLFFKTNAIGEVVTLFTLSIIGANCFTVALLISWAMLPECIDDYFLRYRSKSDALFGSFFIIGPKILMAIYLGISQAILSAVGFVNGVCAEDQNKNVGKAVTYLTSLVPFFIVLISIITIFFYPINEEKAKKNSEEIKKLKSMQKKNVNPNTKFNIYDESVDLNVNDFKKSF